MPTPRRRLILFDQAAPAYLLRDNFDDVLAAGSVNGTPARPGPGTRTVTDTAYLLCLRAAGYAVAYLLYDELVIDRAAGAVHGTLADYVGGARTVTDMESKLSITAS